MTPVQDERYADLTNLPIEELNAVVDQLKAEEAEARAFLQACRDEMQQNPGSAARRRLTQAKMRQQILHIRCSTALHVLQARLLGVQFKRV